MTSLTRLSSSFSSLGLRLRCTPSTPFSLPLASFSTLPLSAPSPPPFVSTPFSVSVSRHTSSPSPNGFVNIRSLSSSNGGSSSETPTTTTTTQDWRNVKLSDYEILPEKHWDGGTKRRRRKKASALDSDSKRPDVTGLQPMTLPKAEADALLAEAFANLPERAGPQRHNKRRRGLQRQRIYRRAYRVQAEQRAAKNLLKMEKRSRVARECREMRALAHELYPEYNAQTGLFGNPSEGRKEYKWMRGRVKDAKIMKRRAEEEVSWRGAGGKTMRKKNTHTHTTR